MRRVVVGLLALIGLVTVVGGIWFAMEGVSARPAPPQWEIKLARGARNLLIPREARNWSNPVEASPEVLTRARRHFADHCASCHGNDGRGNTIMGRGLYPRAPDMTLAASQDLSDGELFWIIQNGIRMTGMPGWGDPDGDDPESWELVHLVRHLPDLSANELEDMERHNPISRAELEEQMAIEEFLRGE